MSKKNKSAHDAPSAHDAHDDHRPDVGLYVKVFGALMVLTMVTVGISTLRLPRPEAIALGLAVAAVKAGLVGAIFMHLWGEAKMIHKFLYVTVACGAIMVIPMIDFVLLAPKYEHPVAVAAQHPDEEGGHVETVTTTIKLIPPAENAKPAATATPSKKAKGK
jgi:caa(3)-type oxidase subunit IV